MAIACFLKRIVFGFQSFELAKYVAVSMGAVPKIFLILLHM